MAQLLDQDTSTQVHQDDGANGPTGIKAGKPTRAKGAKAIKPPSARRPLKLSLPVEVIGKLQLHAIQEGVSVSALVSRLAREHCNEWTIHRSPTRTNAEA
jgi:hypothetical protein